MNHQRHTGRRGGAVVRLSADRHSANRRNFYRHLAVALLLTASLVLLLLGWMYQPESLSAEDTIQGWQERDSVDQFTEPATVKVGQKPVLGEPMSSDSQVANSPVGKNPGKMLEASEDSQDPTCIQTPVFPATIEAGAALEFDQWLAAYKGDAQINGISADTVDTAFKGVRPIQKVIELDRRQSEYTMTFSRYLNNNISQQRISRGKALLRKHAALLKKIDVQYGIQPRFLVALWAMESNFGNNMGGFSTIAALATLAYEGRRSEFFRKELLCALHIIDDGHISASEMKGSWAGAMGQPQFMPSTFVQYAADGDGDGRYDIWLNPADVFASSANYLNQISWDPSHTWGREVRLPNSFDPYLAQFPEKKMIEEWQSLGVRNARGESLPVGVKIKGSIIIPSGVKGPAFLVYQNFRVIREWNRSLNYALTVGHLSDRLWSKDPGSLIAKGPKNEHPLSREDTLTLQQTLSDLNFYTGKIDGMAGLKTRAAIREYQRSRGIPADAYPSMETLKSLRSEQVGDSVESKNVPALDMPKTSFNHPSYLTVFFNNAEVVKNFGYYPRAKIISG